MSKASSPIKVLRTALKRVDKGWRKGTWMHRNQATGEVFVCLEGAVYGYCDQNQHQTTEAQRSAIRVLREIIKEKYGFDDIPTFNDADERTQDEVKEVIKLGIIRLETDEMMDDEDFEDLLEHKERTT